MSRPPLARESVLDAFEAILVDDGERAATMDATARAAGVSKGGLLYHFASKDALEAGLLERLAALVDADIAAIASAPEGPSRTSCARRSCRTTRSTGRSSRPPASHRAAARRRARALRDMREQWEDAIRPHAPDETALDLVMLVSDGLYFNNALAGVDPGPVPRGRHGCAHRAGRAQLHEACGAAATAP